eukprot:2138472-Prymnesium_polylepis.4
MTDCRLDASRKRAAAAVGQVAGGGLDALLASMGSKRAATALAASDARQSASHEPRSTGVGEKVWDPTVVVRTVPRPSGTSALSPPPVAAELLRAQAFRKLQAGVEAELLQVLGPAVVERLEVYSSQTLRNGNGLVDRWLADRRLASLPREGTNHDVRAAV